MQPSGDSDNCHGYLHLPEVAVLRFSSAMLSFWQSRASMALHIRPEPLLRKILLMTTFVD
jgi:hypothetical protein